MLLSRETVNQSKTLWYQHKPVCQSITDELMKFPCSDLLNIPYDCRMRETNAPNKILSFAIISTNISNNMYSEIKEWIVDMKVYFQNAILFHRSSVKSAVYLDFYKKFEKKVRDAEIFHIQGWYKKVLSLKLKIDNLLQNSPPITQLYFPYPKSIEYTTIKTRREEIAYILNNYSKITEPSGVRELLNIINLDIGAPIPNDGILEVDISKLARKTRCKLYDTIKSKLQHSGNQPMSLV